MRRSTYQMAICLCGIAIGVVCLAGGAASALTVEKLTWVEDSDGLMFGTYPREGGGSPTKILESVGMIPMQRVSWDRWSWIETAPGVYSWDVASFAILEDAHKHGAEAVGSIYMADRIPGFYNQDVADPATIQAAQDFIYAFYSEMAERLGKIYIVIDYEMQWYVFAVAGIDPDEWAAWYVALVQAAKQAVPDGIVICDVIADDHDYYLPGDWLTTAMSVSDALGIDDYGLTPQIIHDDVQWMIDNYAGGKPIHILENGFATWDGFSNKAHGTEAEQVQFFDSVIEDLRVSFPGVVKSYVQFMAADRGVGWDIEDHWGLVTYNWETEKPSLELFRQKNQMHRAVILQEELDVTRNLAGGQSIDLTFTDGLNHQGLRVREMINLSSVTRVSLHVAFNDEDGTGTYVVNVNGNWRFCNSPVSNITSIAQHGSNEIEVYFPQKRFPGTVTVHDVGLDLMTVSTRINEDYEEYADEAELQGAWVASELAVSGLETGGGENVFDGDQSMRIDYDLTPGTPYYGTVTHTFPAPQDWTGFEKLLIHYKGLPDNSRESLRLMLIDSQGDAFFMKQKSGATIATTWQTWEILLEDAPQGQLVDTRTIQLKIAGQECDAGTVYLDHFVLVVPPDEFPPTLASAEVVGPLKMKVVFGEKVDPVTAQDIGNYSLNDGATPLILARIGDDSMTVTLKIDGVFYYGTCHELKVSNILDLAGNTISPGLGDSLMVCRRNDNEDHLLDVEAGSGVLVTELVSTYPNPFNPAVNIEYHIASGSERVSLAIFNVTGQRVRTLADGESQAGRHVAVWDGRDDAGKPVGAGVYFCRFEAGSVQANRRLVLVK